MNRNACDSALFGAGIGRSRWGKIESELTEFLCRVFFSSPSFVAEFVVML